MGKNVSSYSFAYLNRATEAPECQTLNDVQRDPTQQPHHLSLQMLRESLNRQLSPCSGKQSENSRLKKSLPCPWHVADWYTASPAVLLASPAFVYCKLSVLLRWLRGKKRVRQGSTWWIQKTGGDSGSWEKLSHMNTQPRLQLVKKHFDIWVTFFPRSNKAKRLWHLNVKRWQWGNDEAEPGSASEAFILQNTPVDSSALSQAKGMFIFWRYSYHKSAAVTLSKETRRTPFSRIYKKRQQFILRHMAHSERALLYKI